MGLTIHFRSILFVTSILLSPSTARPRNVLSWDQHAYSVHILNFRIRGGGNPVVSSVAIPNNIVKVKYKKPKPMSTINSVTIESTALKIPAENGDTKTQTSEKMPSLFNLPDEIHYDTYAACLAATEGLRRARDTVFPETKQLAMKVDTQNWWKSLLHSGTPRSLLVASSNGFTDDKYKKAGMQYILNRNKVISALGLNVSQFNQMGRDIENNPFLKERVISQAYLYRLAATIKMEKIPLTGDPNSKQLLKSYRCSRVQMFARSVSEIENLRAVQTRRLKRALNIDNLPKGIKICDPNVLPVLSPKIRALCEAYPLQAEQIVTKYGLKSDEFNQMLEDFRRNPIFRWRVQKYMVKSGGAMTTTL